MPHLGIRLIEVDHRWDWKRETIESGEVENLDLPPPLSHGGLSEE
tara:strand:+ start:161 stop:295 length:135 start_codon:yes stop_codon:yes gene_type:complete